MTLTDDFALSAAGAVPRLLVALVMVPGCRFLLYRQVHPHRRSIAVFDPRTVTTRGDLV